MTALMYSITSNGITVVTDTLACDVDRRRSHLVAKLGIAPHLATVVAVTGFSNVLTEWMTRINFGMLCLDFDELTTLTPEGVRAVWADVRRSHDLRDDDTTTIYQFGLSSTTGLTGYAFRSRSDFDAELLPSPCFAIKPPPIGPFDTPHTVAEIAALAERIRAEDLELPIDERVMIGGDLIAAAISADGAITCQRIYRFTSFDREWNDMAQRLHGGAT